MSGFLEALSERVLIFDGAMGTQIFDAGLTLEDYWGQENNSEILNLSRPDVIREIHRRYLEAGADCVETNTFGANKIIQGEYGQAEKTFELNVAGARLAREVADSFSDSPRFVVGSIGPGTQLPSLGHTTFEVLEDSYGTQARGLIEGGADALLIETAQDLLQVKAAIAGCVDAFASAGRKLPLMVQVTIQPEGTMLLGSEIGAAVATIAAFDEVDVLGINCATGPVEMIEHVRFICQSWTRFVSVQPNAGLPVMREGRAVYELSPEELLRHHRVFVEEFGVNAVGGCCGTTPTHIELLAASLRGRARPDRTPLAEPSCASLYMAQPFKQSTSFFVVGERCNAQGSRRFKELIGNEEWDQTVQVARDQVRAGAHALDVSVDFVGRNGADDMAKVIERFRTQVTLPLVIDSTEPEVIEAGLKLIGGRPIVNSINLEEGRGPDTRIERNLRAAKKYGAAVVAIAIDERGQATTAQWKLEACSKIFDVAMEFGLKPWDVVFDCVVLPVSTGQEETRRAALETLDGVQAVKKKFPDSYTILGVSNVSFGLSPAARQVLNSVFLNEAIARGLDAAIVSPAHILPMNRIDERQREVALDVLYDRRRDGYDPLGTFIELFTGIEGGGARQKEERAHLGVEERLKARIVDGDRDGLDADLEEALRAHAALAIINDFLLEGMKVVGELFASGEMQLPFVLQSAETMKAAVAYLEPHMERVEDGGKGKIVLATVKGDVHDIGKNLVDIILSNNGYTVYNLGIKQPITTIIEAAQRESADAIGLSGLLVKSTVVMREDLEELNRRDLHDYPVILGGAALTRAYVEKDLREIYRGRVFYGRDAFEGLRTMDLLMGEKRGEAVVEAAPKERRVAVTRTRAPEPADARARSDVATDVPIPTAPFYGNRIVKGIPIAEIAAYLNKTALFRGRWEMRRKRGESQAEYERFIAEQAEPVLRDLLAETIEERLLVPAVVYGYFPAQSSGNDLIVYRDDGTTEWVRFSFPRQQRDRRLCIADFFRPVESAETDVVAFHLVTMGARVGEAARALFERNEYQRYFYLHGLGVEMAEALAEYWHKRIREELGIAGEDDETIPGLFDQGYRGSRYSFGYPACPNLEDQRQIFELLAPERIGVQLSEEFQLDPEQSTSAIIVHHPEAKYFSVGRQ